MAKYLLNTCLIACLTLYLGFTSFLVFDLGSIRLLMTPIGDKTTIISKKKSAIQLRPEYHWQKPSEEAAFPKSCNLQLFSTGDTLYAFHSVGNWYTLDGKSWKKSLLPNILHKLEY